MDKLIKSFQQYVTSENTYSCCTGESDNLNKINIAYSQDIVIFMVKRLHIFYFFNGIQNV